MNMNIIYESTRNSNDRVTASQAILRGLAPDGGLYVPEKIPSFDKTLDEKILLPEMLGISGDGKPLASKNSKALKKQVEVKVSSTDRSFGTILGSEITKRLGSSLEEDTYTVNAIGGGGQSFGAFIPKGLTIRLTGDANDGFGKGLSGGKLIVTPPKNAGYKADENIIIGNVALYGATSGKAYITGIAGERFCVRNSGAIAVSEGCGDHGLEYMTGGRAVILGQTGKNFAAGMSGGIAYVLDTDHSLYKRMNKDLDTLNQVTDKYDIEELKGILTDYHKETGSKKAEMILSDFDTYLPMFKKIVPKDYQIMMSTIAKYENQGLTPDNARTEAFHEIAG